MIQDIITYVLISGSAIYVLFNIYRLVFPARGKSTAHCSGCEGCAGCALRRDAINRVSTRKTN